MVFLGQGVNARVVRTEREGVEGCWRRTSGKLWSLMGFQMEREGYGLEIGSLVQHSEPKRDRRVSGYTEVIEDQSDVAVELAHFLRDTSDAFGFDETDGEASKSSDVFGAVAATDLASVFIVVPIQEGVAKGVLLIGVEAELAKGKDAGAEIGKVPGGEDKKNGCYW